MFMQQRNMRSNSATNIATCYGRLGQLVKCAQQPWRALGAVRLLRCPLVVAAGPQMAVQGSACHSQRDGAYKHHCYGRVTQCARTHEPMRRHNIP